MSRKTAELDLKEWQAIIAEYETGSETQRAFCKRKGITVNSLQYYRSKVSPAQEAPKFQELTLALPPSSTEYEIRVGKVSIIIKGPIVPSEIKELLSVLEE